MNHSFLLFKVMCLGGSPVYCKKCRRVTEYYCPRCAEQARKTCSELEPITPQYESDIGRLWSSGPFCGECGGRLVCSCGFELTDHRELDDTRKTASYAILTRLLTANLDEDQFDELLVFGCQFVDAECGCDNGDTDTVLDEQDQAKDELLLLHERWQSAFNAITADGAVSEAKDALLASMASLGEDPDALTFESVAALAERAAQDHVDSSEAYAQLSEVAKQAGSRVVEQEWVDEDVVDPQFL